MTAPALNGLPPTDTTELQPAPLMQVVDDPLELGRFTRWVSGPAGERWAESSLQLAGLRCAACSGIIEEALRRVPGVQGADVSAAAERATVRWDPDLARPSQLIAAVRRAGYDAVPDAAAPAREMRRQTQRQALWRLFVAGFCAMQVMMFATPSYVAGPGELSDEMRQLLNWGCWLVSLPVMAFSAAPFFSGAWRMLRQRRMGMDVPVALGIAITFIASTGATFEPQGIFGHEVYFDSLTMFISFLLGARWLELRARQQAAESLERALARLPETAWRVGADGQVSAVSVQRLHVGDLVQVPLGQAFPADGSVEQGQTQADEALLSGESTPVAKAEGEGVVAGSINVGAPVRVRVQRVGGDTRLETIVSMMRSAMTQRPSAARVADRWAGPFLWAVLLLAAGAAAVWSVVDPSRAVWVAVSVLIVTCPCALSLAAPATLVAAARGLARRGVLVQRLDAIEGLATAQHFFFDKTGTLTEDRLQWAGTRVCEAGRQGGQTADGLLATAASLARWSSHPAACALSDASAAIQDWQGVEEQPGLGLQAQDAAGLRWQLGSARWLGVADAQPGERLFLACEGRCLAAFRLDEVLRPGAAEAVAALRAQGVSVRLVSGDTLGSAQELATRVGIDDVMAQASPEGKLAALALLQAQGQRVVMVGDGVNDAPVLARADVSLAMGQGALVSRSHADAVITSNRLEDVVRARATAQRALRIMRQNFIWAAAYNGLCIPLALAGWLPPWAAGLGMACSSLLVVLNALRAVR
jgi:Cu2+-exporting ATPase